MDDPEVTFGNTDESPTPESDSIEENAELEEQHNEHTEAAMVDEEVAIDVPQDQQEPDQETENRRSSRIRRPPERYGEFVTEEDLDDLEDSMYDRIVSGGNEEEEKLTDGDAHPKGEVL